MANTVQFESEHVVGSLQSFAGNAAYFRGQYRRALDRTDANGNSNPNKAALEAVADVTHAYRMVVEANEALAGALAAGNYGDPDEVRELSRATARLKLTAAQLEEDTPRPESRCQYITRKAKEHYDLALGLGVPAALYTFHKAHTAMLLALGYVAPHAAGAFEGAAAALRNATNATQP